MNSTRSGPLYAWIGILSLDAPLVALLWQQGFAQATGANLHWGHRAVLGLSVWLAYMADRWLDAWRQRGRPLVTLRHQFAARHRIPIAIGWMLLLIADVLLAFATLELRTLLNGMILVALIGIHLFLNQQQQRWHWLQGGKELGVAVIFSMGTVWFCFDSWRSISLWEMLAVALFCGLVFLNCVLIAGWDRKVDEDHNQPSIAIRWPVLCRQFPKLVFLYGVFCLRGLVFPGSGEALRWIHVDCLIAATLLAWLHLRENSLSYESRNFLADAALMTPVISIPFH